ncbi:MAG: hypothetical protein IT449_01145 [Phycisphaerales bacterium]|nr:hypothetical protein [Phycisphaerales bacterium]
MRIVSHLLVLFGLLTLASCATVETRPSEQLIQEFRGETTETWRGEAQLADACAKVLDALMPGLSAEKELDRQQAEQTLEDLCVRAGRPGAGRNRAALCSAMAARIGPSTAQPARLWLLRQLARIGGRECVNGLTATLADADVKVRDAARRALQRNPDRRAAAALREELEVACNPRSREPLGGGIAEPAMQVRDPAWCVALIDAVAARRDPGDESLLVDLALRGDAPLSSSAGAGGTGSTESMIADEPVACAAVAALGDLGAADAVERIAARKASAPHSVLFGRIAEARLRCAERMLASRKPSEAANQYRKVYDSAERRDIRVAAMTGMAKALGAGALPFLLERMNDEDAAVRVAAAAAAVELPGDSVTTALADHLSSLPADAQVRLVDGLGSRGGTTARLAVLGALQSPTAEVRTAATRAMTHVGNATHVRLLARLAAERKGEEQKAARESLAALRDQKSDETAVISKFDEAAAYAIGSSPAPIQAELFRALKTRQTNPGLVVMTALSVIEAGDPIAQIAALECLGAMADEHATLKLIGSMHLFKEEAVRSAAEDAVVAASLRRPEGTRSSAPLAFLQSGGPSESASCLRILGRIGEPMGLEAIRTHLSATAEPVKEAAVRALCDWKDAAALPDVQSLMKTSTDATHRTLAVRAYVRLVRLPDAQRTPQQSLAMYDEALTLAKSPDEKKLVFSGMADLACVEALDRLEAALSDATLQAEAAVALCSVARNVCGGSPDRARAALNRVREYAAGDAVKGAADEALKHIDRYQGYITRWKFTGPYSVSGKDAGDLFDIPAGPEPGFDATAAATASLGQIEWRDLPVTDAKSPWLFDLNKAASGSNCCVYVRATLTCQAAAAARLEIGSDDCVKVWLNGKPVHANKSFRPLSEAADTVNVALNAGANDLLLKIVQGSGGWGVCCGVKAADGGNLQGLANNAP